MATREEIFSAVIKINDKEAKDKLGQMAKQMEKLKKRRDEALASGNLDLWKSLGKEMDKLSNSMKKQDTLAQGLNKAMNNLSTAKQKELEQIIRTINRHLNSGAVERNSQEWKALNESLKDAKKELRLIKKEGEEQPSVWNKFFKFLNDSWGGVLIIFQSITGMSNIIRSTVKDYAAMEQEMANVRKYTGQTMKEVAEMNDMFKKIDTRTSREELNQLAGSAGRLGISATDDIMEFVDAADKINVALGDDLGKGAVDNIGKLAMAFGEDEKMGLRGAMLATGSAVNELAQSSAANAGYLVDFTARVAGVGKQLGLTQAQIMGFGAVMDENMLRDEMASTAFSQLITAMATDAEKFSKFAGVEGKKFAEMVKTDINGAVLALADNIKKQDPSTMLKMFTDMGLDGSRAVGVLANMADKIDDVRRHQATANKAYAEGVSIQKEFEVQNTTVEAGLDKVKKQFKDMSVELGEKLMPVVKYTISSAGLLVKGLSYLVDFLIENRKTILTLTAATIIYNAALIKKVALQKLDIALTFAQSVATKSLVVAKNLLRGSLVALQAGWAFLTKGVHAYTVVMRAARMASIANPWTAFATVLTVVGAAVYSLVKGWKDHKRALQEQDPAFRAALRHAKDMNDIAKSVNESTAKELATIRRLTTVIRSNAYSINERKGAIKQLQEIVPEYHASIDKEGKLIGENTRALDDYITNLKKAARAQAYMDKMTELERERLDNDLVIRAKQTNIKAVDAELQRGERMGDKNPYKSVKGKQYYNAYGVGYGDDVELNSARSEKLKERAIHENALNDALSKRVELNKTLKKYEESMRADGITPLEVVDRKKPEKTDPTVTPYVSVDEEEQKKILKSRADAAKASYEQQIAEEMLAYRQGISTYTDYIEEKHRITQNYYDQMKRIYGKDSNEYRLLLENREREEAEYYSWQKKGKEDDLLLDKLAKEHSIKMQYLEEGAINEEAMNEALFQNEIDYLKRKQKLHNDGSKEWLQIQMQIDDEEKKHRWKNEEDFQRRLLNYKEEAAKTLAKVRKKTGSETVEATDGATGVYSIITAISQQEMINEELKRLYGEDYENNKEYQEAKRQLDNETMQKIMAGAQAAYSAIGDLMAGISAYSQACSDVEVSKIEANYERQIAAAGKNSKKREQLEKERDKKIADAKTKANKKAMPLEIAQAVAQTAMAAINAYSSASKEHWLLGPIAASMALAAGAIQIATIKKQHQAQQAGYYEGGYTGGKNYRKEAGVVHEGEFVANHHAVSNRNLAPVFDLIDQAQRNNRVATLTAADVTNVMGSNAAAVVAPVVNVVQDNSELREQLEDLRSTVGILAEELQNGIQAYAVIDGPNGTYKQLRKYEKLIGK